ncbi:putative Zinc finger, RING-type [Septoria linicola]|nr:putative Zinc finger, RING-type [Septoria linicola]
MLEYDEAAMLAKAHLYSPANLAQRKLSPGTLIMVRRANASFTTSTLLVVTEVNENVDPLDCVTVSVVPTSTVPQALRLHLMQIENADHVMRSIHVMQGMHALIESNGSPSPLSQHVTLDDRVFVRPTGGSVRRYLLDNRCPNPLCRNGVCQDRPQAYRRYPSLAAGVRPDTLRWLLTESSGYRMLCPGCYGLKLVRRDEMKAVAFFMIVSGRRQPVPGLMDEITRHQESVRYVYQLELGHNMHNDPIAPAQSREEGQESSAAGPSSATSPTAPNVTLREGAPMHPGRRSAEEQLAAINSSGAGRTISTPRQPDASPFSAAQLAGIAARRREEHRDAQEASRPSSAAQASTSTNRQPVPGPSRTPANRQLTIEELIRAPDDTSRPNPSLPSPPPNRNPAPRSPSPTPPASTGSSLGWGLTGWQEIPNSLRQEWSAMGLWQPIPPAWQALWDSLGDWEEISSEAQAEMDRGNERPRRTSKEVMLRQEVLRYKDWKKKYPRKVGDDCSICLEPFAEGGPEGLVFTTRECGHAFHNVCAEEWFRGSGKCPLCNGRLQ